MISFYGGWRQLNTTEIAAPSMIFTLSHPSFVRTESRRTPQSVVAAQRNLTGLFRIFLSVCFPVSFMSADHGLPVFIVIPLLLGTHFIRVILAPIGPPQEPRGFVSTIFLSAALSGPLWVSRSISPVKLPSAKPATSRSSMSAKFLWRKLRQRFACLTDRASLLYDFFSHDLNLRRKVRLWTGSADRLSGLSSRLHFSTEGALCSR